jgi:hypothetical protein
MPVTVGTNSYCTETELADYASLRGIVIAGDKTQLLIKAMDWLENHNFVGKKVESTQALKWPRTKTNLSDDVLYDAHEVPNDIKWAQLVAAIIYDEGGDPLANIDRAVKREKVDVIEVEYMDNAVSNPVYPFLNMLISGYLNPSQSGGTSFGVSRG